jgi:hypothetical protein
MRFVLAFFVAAGLWLVVSGYWDGRKGLDDVGSFFGFGEVDPNAPNWGDVAAKIGELAAERDGLQEGLAEEEGRSGE